MQGIEVLYWALSTVFCLALFFAILIWCRNWRREEQENNAHQIQLLAKEVRRLTETIETLDHTSASLQTADEQFTRQLETLRNTVRDLKRFSFPPPSPPTSVPLSPSPTKPESEPLFSEDTEDRYTQARALLRAGHDPVEVARQLDLGTAEVRMIARLLASPDTHT